MSGGFTLVRVGRFRRSAARGMARAGFPAWMIRHVLGLSRATAATIVAARDAPPLLWSAAEIALFRESGR